MQILMGVHTTLIKINEPEVQTKNLFYFIQTSFKLLTQNEKQIIIDYQEQEYHKRVFLIKWLYAIQVKLTGQEIPKLKELLVTRIKKPIKIEFKNILKKQINVNVEMMENSFLHVSLNLFDAYFMDELKSIVSKYVAYTQYDARTIIIDISTNDLKSNTKELLSNEKDLLYIFSDKNIIFEALEVLQAKNRLDDYFILLDSSKKDSMQTIKKRYKKLRKQYHPDNVFYRKDDATQEYTEKFQLLQNAYTAVSEQFFLCKI